MHFLSKQSIILDQINEAAIEVGSKIKRIEIRACLGSHKGVAALIFNSKPEEMQDELRSTYFRQLPLERYFVSNAC